MELVTLFAGAFIIGIIMGLMGGGGSILTVPLLVYVFGINPVIATAYSLFIVGTTAVFGSAQHYIKKTIALRTGAIIAIPSFIGVYITRSFILPALPDVIFNIGDLEVTRDNFIMTIFGIIMMMASLSMLTRKISNGEKETKKLNYPILLPIVAIIGLIMGLVGAGGGFLIIPMLVFFGGLPMKKAVGTSLFIIAINSLIGFLGDLQTIEIDWQFLLSFTIVSVFGIFAGTYLQKFVKEKQLRHAFGWFVLVMAAFILSKEIIGW
ncbi:MAG: permease [Flavobacterium psychrophilum]|nr:MAG: permease [Flavobacterium psychrophilum]